MAHAKKTSKTQNAATLPKAAQPKVAVQPNESLSVNLATVSDQVEKQTNLLFERTVKAHELAEQNVEHASDLIKGQMVAIAASQQAFLKGWIALTSLGFEQLRENVAAVETATETLLASQSLQEATELQTKFVQTECDRVVGNAQRLADVAAHVADDVAAPLRDQTETVLADVRAQLAA